MCQRTKDYWMPPHVRACTTAAGTILLDLERNRYFGLGSKETHALFTLAVISLEAKGQTADILEPMTPEAAARIADALVESGLLSRNPPADSVIAPGAIDLSGTLASVGHELDSRVSIRFHHVINFLRACAWARWALRSRPLYSVARELNLKKAVASDYFDVQRAIELVCVFRRLRPYAFTAREQCLFHALSLVKFLAGYEVFPTWVIGVRSHPWAAHSWVQHDRLILDSSPEQVCEYTPILTV